MSDRREEFRVGVVALATVAIVVLLVALNTGTSFSLGGGSPYEIQIRVDRAPGVGPNTPVRKDGVLIGRVVSTEFLPEGGVLVRASIQRDAPIYRSDTCRIQPSSLFGDAVINFVYAGGVTDPTPIAAGDSVGGAALPDPIEALTSLQVQVGPAVDSIGEAADGVARLTDKLNRALGEDFAVEGVESLVDQATRAMDQFSVTMRQMQGTIASIDEFVGDAQVRDSLRAAANDLPGLLADTRETVRTATETLDSLSGVVERAGTNLRNLEGLTEPLGERGQEIAQSLLSAVDILNEVLLDVQEFATALNDSEGTVSRLVKDRTIADNLETTIANANTVVVRVNEMLKELRPILYDVRVFTDKIAREPGRLIGGAVNRGPGLK